MATPLTLISKFIIGGLQKDVTVEDLYNKLELDKFPCKGVIELSLVVNKNGHSKGFALLQIPRSATNRLLQYDQCILNGQPMVITHQEGNFHMIRDMKWVKTYKDKGMITTTSAKPQVMVYRYKSTKGQAVSADQKSDIDPLYDMFADLTHKKFNPDLDTILAQSYKLGVDSVVVPGQGIKQRKRALEMIEEFNTFVKIYLSTGIPPCNAKDYDTNKQAEIEKDCSSIDWRCIGPIGLDFKLKDVSKEDQIYAFEEQIKLACAKRKPLYLVEHEAHQEFVDILTKYDKHLPKCAIVNFEGTLEELEKYVSMGFYIAVYGGINSYRCVLTTVISEALRNNKLPRKQILLASNAPRTTWSTLLNPSYRPTVSKQSLDKLSKNSSRSEPLNIFPTLELVGKHLGCDKIEEINELGKEIVQNSKEFLGLRVPTGKKTSDKKEEKPKVCPDAKKVKKINKLFVAFVLAVLLLAIFLEYMSGIPEIKSRYFYRHTVF